MSNKVTDLGTVIAAAQQATGIKKLPPVDLWEPDYCGDIGMKIARNGQWFYAGSPIGRQKLVELFATILRHDADGEYYLVTPAEKIRVEVEDAPFIAVHIGIEGEGQAQKLHFVTNVGDYVQAGPEHSLRFEIDPETDEPAPYLHVRARLEAKLGRAVFYELVEYGSEHDGFFGVWSDGVFFPMMEADRLE